MSAIDQAFLKAFGKSPKHRGDGSRQGSTRAVLQSLANQRSESESNARRIEQPGGEQANVPSPHLSFADQTATQEDVVMSHGEVNFEGSSFLVSPTPPSDDPTDHVTRSAPPAPSPERQVNLQVATPRDHLASPSAQPLPPQQAAPQQTAPLQFASLQSAPPQAAPPQAAPPQAAPPQAAPQKAAPQHAAPQHAAPQHAAPQHAAPQHAAPRHSTPQQSAPQPFTPEPFAPQPFAPQNSTPQHSTPQHSAPQHSAPQHSAPQHSAPQDSTPQHSTPQHSAPQHSAPQHSAPQQSAPQPFTPEPFAPQPFTPEPFAPQPSAPQPSASLQFDSPTVFRMADHTPAQRDRDSRADLAPPLEPPAISPTIDEDAEKKALPGEPAVRERKAFQAAWEVDRFIWPAICEELYATQKEYFDESGRQLLAATKEGLNVLAVTSAQRKEGRSTIALCLAKCAAAAGVRVVLVDADLDHPRLAKDLQLAPSLGWQATVREGEPLSEVAIASVEDGFCLLPLTEDVVKAPFPLNAPLVSETIREAAACFDLVIIDLGPVGGEDCRMFEEGEDCPIDAAIVVRDLRCTDTFQLASIVGQLQRTGVSAVGVAENFA